MKRLAVLVCGLVSACNYDTGECYPRHEGGEGVGGNVVPTGGGGFGDVPPEPQDVSDPADPCSSQTARCTVTWKAGSGVCKEQGTTSTCTTSYQCAHATLDDAKKDCERVNGVGNESGALSCGPCEWETSASNACDDKYQDCQANGPTSCLKEDGGKSLCYRCWERCNAGDSPSARCRTCKF